MEDVPGSTGTAGIAPSAPGARPGLEPDASGPEFVNNTRRSSGSSTTPPPEPPPTSHAILPEIPANPGLKIAQKFNDWLNEAKCMQLHAVPQMSGVQRIKALSVAHKLQKYLFVWSAAVVAPCSSAWLARQSSEGRSCQDHSPTGNRAAGEFQPRLPGWLLFFGKHSKQWDGFLEHICGMLGG